ncbi:GAF domain-containing protein [Actinopolymorpha sp. B17G11]|uniref:GAF domain-containing protein n=1 Tax=unclassified Actinopolymorpha TaxID=2627063 RepID=UPI0032D91C7D
MATLLRQLDECPANSLGVVSPDDCARILDVDGICASRIDIEDGLLMWHMLWCCDSISEALNELRTQRAEGPGVHAVLRNTPVLVPDLATPQVQARWPGYAMAALALGVHAVFAFPLRRRNAPFGAIVAYRRRQGFLRSVDDARALTDAAAQILAA